MPMEPVDFTDDGHFPPKEAGYHTDENGVAKWGRDGKSVNEMCWDLLDECIDKIKKLMKLDTLETAQVNDLLSLKGYANGVADCLAFWAPPPYQSRELVLREAQSRWKMRMGELDWRPTPGYHAGWKPEAGEKFHGPRPINTALDRAAKEAERGTPRRRRPASKKTRPKSDLPRDKVDGIVTALESGWEVADIANLFKVDVSKVKELQS